MHRGGPSEGIVKQASLGPSAAVVACNHVTQAMVQGEDGVVVRSSMHGGVGLPEERLMVPPHAQLHAAAHGFVSQACRGVQYISQACRPLAAALGSQYAHPDSR
jgi:hypothetical protein